ncbi:MAG: phasin family protein [Candidatus Aerophobetes bacterium]|nr:phasin family protein [Candidatus Aerophobetes bacterium]
MEKLLRDVFLVGLGVLSLTREKAEEIVEELTRLRGVTEKEKRTLLERLIKKGEEQKKEIDERIGERVEKVVSRLKVATKEDIERLEKKIEELKKKLS